MFLGLVRTSYMMGRCIKGSRKCVPSLTTFSCTPEKRSKMTARVPPLTSYIAACTPEMVTKTGMAHLETVFRMLGAAMMIGKGESGSWDGGDGWRWSRCCAEVLKLSWLSSKLGQTLSLKCMKLFLSTSIELPCSLLHSEYLQHILLYFSVARDSFSR